MYTQEEEEAETQIHLHAAHADEDRLRGSHIGRMGGGREGGRGEGEPAGTGAGGGEISLHDGIQNWKSNGSGFPPFPFFFNCSPLMLGFKTRF